MVTSMTNARSPRPAPLDSILLGRIEIEQGKPFTDIILRLLLIAPALSQDDRVGILVQCEGNAVLAEVCRSLFQGALDRSAARGDAVAEADRTWTTCVRINRDVVERADDACVWHETPLAARAIRDLYELLSFYGALYGQVEARASLIDILWEFARDVVPGTDKLIRRAVGLELLREGSSRLPTYRFGSNQFVDVLGVAEDHASRHLRPSTSSAPETHAEPIEDDRAGIVRLAPSVDPEPEPPEPAGVVVAPRIGGGTKGTSNRDVAAEFKDVIGRIYPLYPFPSDRRALVERAAAQAPHARRFFEDLVALQDTREHWALPPVLALGPPGGGKTTAIDDFFRSAGVHVERYACDGSSDNAAAGTPRRWNSGEVTLPLRAALTAGHANPAILWDEVNRAAGNSQSNGTLRDALTSMTERSNAVRYRDPYLEAETDLSYAQHMATANGLAGFPAQLADRFRVLHFPLPGPEHMPALARRMAVEIVRRQGLPDDVADLDRTDLAALAQNWPGGSLRSLQRLVEIAIRVRLTVPYETRH